jgi:hypothetical protein
MCRAKLNFSAPTNTYMKLRQNGIVSFPIRLAVFQARGGARMKLIHLDRIIRIYFGLVFLYPVHPVDPVRK